MAIPPELSRFTNEEAFRDHFLVPLFLRFGFSVHNYHGIREYGKDLLLGKIDEFNHRIYYGIQAKFNESIGQGQAGDMIRDVCEAFDNPFRHPQDGTEQRISRFYIANGGSISEGARDNFFNGIHDPVRKANTCLFDAKALIYLDRFASFNRNGLVREQVTAVQIEVRINQQIMAALEKTIHEFVTNKGPYPVARLRSQACSCWLERPPIADPQFYGVVHDFFLSVQMLNYIADSMDQLLYAPDYQATRNAGFKEVCIAARSQGVAIDERATVILHQLSPLI